MDAASATVQAHRQPSPPRPQQELREDGELGFWEIGSEVGYVNYFLFWRRGMRLKRIHHVLVEYEQKVMMPLTAY